MDYIKEALTKSKASLDHRLVIDRQSVSEPKRARAPAPAPEPKPTPSWTPPVVHLDGDHLAKSRIVSFAMKDPSHIAFNLLRTRVRKALQEQKWKTLAVTSPTKGCGKTMVALNLAFSLARTPDCRTVLIDLDLKKPAVGRTLGASAGGSIGRYLEGKADAKDCFIQINPNLVVGTNKHPIVHSSELIQGPRMTSLLSFVSSSLDPDVVIFDLPPMRSSDDALSLIPTIDATLLVVAAGKSTVAEIDESERQISQFEKLLGIVLNKAESKIKDYYY